MPPVRTPDGSRLVASLERAVRRVVGRDATQVASPGTYDHKHVDRLACHRRRRGIVVAFHDLHDLRVEPPAQVAGDRFGAGVQLSEPRGVDDRVPESENPDLPPPAPAAASSDVDADTATRS